MRLVTSHPPGWRLEKEEKERKGKRGQGRGETVLSTLCWQECEMAPLSWETLTARRKVNRPPRLGAQT